MKTAEIKTSSSARNLIQAKRQPFFSKEGQDSFFSKSNETSSSFFSPTNIQPKLTIGQPNDKYEVEADAMADRVVQRLSETSNQNVSTGITISPTIQRKCSSCEEEEEKLQKKEDDFSPNGLDIQRKTIFESDAERPDAHVQTKPMAAPVIQAKCPRCEEEQKLHRKPNSSNLPTAPPQIESSLNASKGDGSPIPPSIRHEMEISFGADFSNVRLHTDNAAVQMNNSMHSQAFTHGSDIYFNQGKYDTNSTKGKHLLAHELTHTVQQGEARGTHGTVQMGLWDDIKSVASDVGSGIASGVSAVGGAISSGVSAVGGAIERGVSSIGGALGAAWSKASTFIGDSATWVFEGLKTLGSTALNWLSTAGSHVWSAIKWLGSKAWDGIKWLGSFLWEKLALIGSNLWSFLSNVPFRLWRIIVHGWEGIKGALGWAWDGLRGAAGHIWNGLTGVFTWLGKGIDGAINWLLSGVQSGFKWALDFIQDPSLSKLWDAITGSLSWVWEGLKGFGRWGWHGVVAAAVWAWKGLKAFGGWLLDGIIGGLAWLGKLLMYVLDLLGVGEALQIIWGLIFRMRKLTKVEIDASSLVHPPGMIPYDLIRVDENSVISMIGGAAVTTLHVIHTPKGGIPLDVMVHELTHVAQYEYVGSVYMPQALHAQAKHGRSGGRGSGSAYDYERTGTLAQQRAAGRTFKDLNRESQAELVQDYYLCISSTPPNPCLDHVPFINDMKDGKF